MSDNELFERCDACNGTGIIVDGNKPLVCTRCDGGGFIPIGLTLGQVERAIRVAERGGHRVSLRPGSN